jgi:hypothetical protein
MSDRRSAAEVRRRIERGAQTRIDRARTEHEPWEISGAGKVTYPKRFCGRTAKQLSPRVAERSDV